MEKKIIGIDLGGTSIKFAIITLAGEIQQKWSIPTNILDEGSHIVDDISANLLGKADQHRNTEALDARLRRIELRPRRLGESQHRHHRRKGVHKRIDQFCIHRLLSFCKAHIDPDGSDRQLHADTERRHAGTYNMHLRARDRPRRRQSQFLPIQDIVDL